MLRKFYLVFVKKLKNKSVKYKILLNIKNVKIKGLD